MSQIPSFINKPSSEIRAMLSKLSDKELDDLLKDRYLRGLDLSNKKINLINLISQKKEACALAIKNKDSVRVQQLNREIDSLRAEKAGVQRNVEIMHLESNCCFIEFVERGLINPAKDIDIEDKFPFINYEALDEFRVKNGYLPEPPQSGSRR